MPNLLPKSDVIVLSWGSLPTVIITVDALRVSDRDWGFSHWAHDVVATLNQRRYVATTSCAQWARVCMFWFIACCCLVLHSSLSILPGCRRHITCCTFDCHVARYTLTIVDLPAYILKIITYLSCINACVDPPPLIGPGHDIEYNILSRIPSYSQMFVICLYSK